MNAAGFLLRVGEEGLKLWEDVKEATVFGYLAVVLEV